MYFKKDIAEYDFIIFMGILRKIFIEIFFVNILQFIKNGIHLY